VRASVLAGRKLPAVWVPDPETRDDREPLRLRLSLAKQRTQIKNQIRCLVKRSKLSLPDWFTKSGDWSKRSVAWLLAVAAGDEGNLLAGVRAVLARLVALYESFSEQLKALDEVIGKLAKNKRYANAFRKLKLIKGVGTLTAMVFLTEIGDLNRFANRRQLAAYLGLAPAAFESGERDDRKGRITRQGPAQVRHVLCQAAWTAVRCTDKWKDAYERVKRGTQKRNKVAIVAVMRKLAITMWHTARSEEVDELLDEMDEIRAEQQQPADRKRKVA